MTYADGGVADVDGVVGVGGVDVELQDIVDVVSLYLQRAQALHHSGLAAQQLKQTVGQAAEFGSSKSSYKKNTRCPKKSGIIVKAIIFWVLNIITLLWERFHSG